MVFETTFLVRFAHVDPAGIVFYPRYYEMLSAATEDWFVQSLGIDYRTMHFDYCRGVPTVRLNAQFHRPTSLGEELTIAIQPVRLGRSSCDVEVRFSHGDELRVLFEQTIVWTNLKTLKSEPWPDDIRSDLDRQLAAIEDLPNK
jgi:4-hydroxybenzoyl-CoA thioesterase